MSYQYFLEEMKKQSRAGRCLHFDNGSQCTEIIESHSIQKGGQLSRISEQGHVYRVDFDSKLGALSFKKTGIKKASAFPGFCAKHDNQLFAPIDNFPLLPSLQQIALYAYRCVCREYFVKDGAVKGWTNIVNSEKTFPEAKDFFKIILKGTAIGQKTLDHHKKLFDLSLRESFFDQFQYVAFESEDEEFMQLSGLLYPEFDFQGIRLQMLGLEVPRNQLITYFTAPTQKGWAFCFAWHISSKEICENFIRSFATHCHLGNDVGSALLRFVLSTCENHAFKISWIDGLPPAAKDEMMERMSLAAHPEKPILRNYLQSGCEGIVKINFTRVWSQHW